MNEDRKKRILILTADAGFGHRSAANAVAKALADKYADRCEYEVVNPMEDRRTPFFLRDMQADYDTLVRTAPELYRIGYDMSDAHVPSTIVESALTVLMYEVMQDIIGNFQPDAILTTYPMYQEPLSAIFKITRRYIPLVTAITDLANVHRIWFNPNLDQCLAPTPQVKEAGIQYGIPAEKIHITGIPVNPAIIRETREKKEIRSALGWDPDLITFFAVGSRRVENLIEVLNVFNHFGGNFQLIVSAGKDEGLYRRLKEINWHVPNHVYEFIDNMPPLLKASDALISKAGGLIVTEGLACGLPLFLISAIHGQETGNVEYVISSGAGDLAEEPIKILENLSHWMLEDARLLKERAQNARSIGQPMSAYKAADIAFEAACSGPMEKQSQWAIERTRLLKLLKENHVNLELNLFKKIIK